MRKDKEMGRKGRMRGVVGKEEEKGVTTVTGKGEIKTGREGHSEKAGNIKVLDHLK